MRPAALAALAAFAVAGCATVHTSAGLTRAQFIARADAICQAEQRKIQRVAAAEGTSVASTPRMIRHAVAIHEGVSSELQSLVQPAGEQAPIASWLNARAVATTIEGDTAQALAKQLPTAPGVQRERERASENVSRLARAYGLGACAVLE